MESFLSKVALWLTKRDSINQLIVWIISPIFISNLPIIAFIIFMNENAVFSYDFFLNGLFGLNTFFIFSAFFTFIFGFLLTGAIVPALEILIRIRNNEQKFASLFLTFTENSSSETRYFLYIMFALNVAFHFLLFKSRFDFNAYFLLLTVGFVVNFHIGMLLFASAKSKLISLIILISFIFFSLFNFHKVTAELVALGMKKFNTGGNPKVSISHESNKSIEIAEGELILLSPANIFINTPNGLEIMGRNNKIIYFYKDNNNSNPSS